MTSAIQLYHPNYLRIFPVTAAGIAAFPIPTLPEFDLDQLLEATCLGFSSILSREKKLYDKLSYSRRIPIFPVLHGMSDKEDRSAHVLFNVYIMTTLPTRMVHRTCTRRRGWEQQSGPMLSTCMLPRGQLALVVRGRMQGNEITLVNSFFQWLVYSLLYWSFSTPTMQPVLCRSMLLVLYGLQAEAQPGPCLEMPETAEIVCYTHEWRWDISYSSYLSLDLISEDVIEHSFAGCAVL